jgi:type IV pilus assembly protein PilM
MRVVVVAARETMVRGFIEAAREAGLRPEGIDLDAFALVRTLAPDVPSAEEAAVYCHLAGVTNLAVAAGRLCLFSRPLEARLDDDVAARPLAEEIRLSIGSYGALAQAPPVVRVVLSGPRARREGLADELAELLDLPVELAAPLGRLELNGAGSVDEPSRLTIAAGLALGATA